MKTSYIVWVVILLVVIIGAFWYLGQNSTSPTSTQTSTSTTQTQTPAAFLPDATSSARSFSTVPSNGDANPYGVAFVPAGFPSGGPLNPGDILVSNWNDTKIQGAGTTIVRITPSGQQSLFFQAKKGSGLTTALSVLKSGFVIVGNLPTTDGTGATAKSGSLLVLNNKGGLVATLTDKTLVDGPWDMAVNDNGAQVQAFVTNVLSGTVVRFDLVFTATGLTSQKGTIIASGYGHHTDPNAAVVGPTGLVYDAANDTLFVASTVDNAVYSIPNAGSLTASQGMGVVVYKDDQHLHGPLGLVQAPNGDFLVTNGDAINTDPSQSSEVVEFTSGGVFVKELSLDPSGGGAFGLAIKASGSTATFAAVDDNIPTLFVWSIPIQ
jgi:hypothetical protein